MPYWNGMTPWTTLGWIGLGLCLIFMVLMALACLWLMGARMDLRCMGGRSSEAQDDSEKWRQEALRLEEELLTLRDQR